MSESSLKNLTVNGLFWSVVDNYATYGIQFVVGIILARLLTPREYGLLGMILIFIALSQAIMNSGFSNALIKKHACSQEDYSTVFYYNLLAGILMMLLLWFAAPAVSRFFHEEELIRILRVLSIVLIVNALSIVHRTHLIIRIDFRLQARISVISSTLSGLLAIGLAYRGFGVWSLVFQQLSRQVLVSILLWVWNTWHPSLVFSRQSFRELFGFGSRLMLTSLIDTAYQHIYYIVIGKYFAAAELGYYTRADQFRNFASRNITTVIQRVTFPVLSSVQNDVERLKNYYTTIIRSTMFIAFSLMIGLAAVARPFVLALIGEKWLPSVPYLQLLCFAGMLFPLNAINLNMLMVQGRSDLFLNLEIIKKILAVPTIILGVIWGIKVMIWGMIINSIIAYYLNSYWSGKKIGYSMAAQILDILPSLLLAAVMGIGVSALGRILSFTPALNLVIMILAGFAFVLLAGELLKLRDYRFLKQTATDKLKTFRKP